MVSCQTAAAVAHQLGSVPPDDTKRDAERPQRRQHGRQVRLPDLPAARYDLHCPCCRRLNAASLKHMSMNLGALCDDQHSQWPCLCWPRLADPMMLCIAVVAEEHDRRECDFQVQSSGCSSCLPVVEAAVQRLEPSRCPCDPSPQSHSIAAHTAAAATPGAALASLLCVRLRWQHVLRQPKHGQKLQSLHR